MTEKFVNVSNAGMWFLMLYLKVSLFYTAISKVEIFHSISILNAKFEISVAICRLSV